ncbi:hypothetical protein [Pseudanabaena sp. FACHB-2040]|uniref:hypothetical protein n=1 Tax=Pseudanabaena sp. FACHB-2040 TaxID=2692859 RepID=UPI001686D8AB|nr:hypothetical protein [Pseudanabaena sp. FACHB-2040]MBD2261050.1 hypothetical protein [Pseudanabaena sp. FACHB-2040]
MSPLALQYVEAFDANCLLDAESWFQEDTPQEQLDLLNNLVVSEDVARKMLLEGETCWHHLGWWSDVLRVLEDWAQKGKLIKVRLIAQWLLSTLPAATSNPDAASVLQKLSDGQFCEVFSPLSCIWPAKPQFYLKHLQWSMFEDAEFAAMDQAAEIRTAILRKWRVVEP